MRSSASSISTSMSKHKVEANTGRLGHTSLLPVIYIRFNFSTSHVTAQVRARVLASMATSTFYIVYVALAKDTGDIEGGECICVAGKGGICKHVCCVLYGLMTIVTQELKQVPAEVTCTEAEMKWYARSKGP